MNGLLKQSVQYVLTYLVLSNIKTCFPWVSLCWMELLGPERFASLMFAWNMSSCLPTQFIKLFPFAPVSYKTSTSSSKP